MTAFKKYYHEKKSFAGGQVAARTLIDCTSMQKPRLIVRTRKEYYRCHWQRRQIGTWTWFLRKESASFKNIYIIKSLRIIIGRMDEFQNRGQIRSLCWAWIFEEVTVFSGFPRFIERDRYYFRSFGWSFFKIIVGSGDLEMSTFHKPQNQETWMDGYMQKTSMKRDLVHT